MRAAFKVSLRYDHMGAPDPTPLAVVFLQEEAPVAEILVKGNNQWHNLSLYGGSYRMRIYEADTGLFYKEREFYVLMDIELSFNILF